MRRAFNLLFLLGALSSLYFIVGNALHLMGSGFAILFAAGCFFSGIFIRVMQVWHQYPNTESEDGIGIELD